MAIIRHARNHHEIQAQAPATGMGIIERKFADVVDSLNRKVGVVAGTLEDGVRDASRQKGYDLVVEYMKSKGLDIQTATEGGN
jgi:hypothetical protein